MTNIERKMLVHDIGVYILGEQLGKYNVTITEALAILVLVFDLIIRSIANSINIKPNQLKEKFIEALVLIDKLEDNVSESMVAN